MKTLNGIVAICIFTSMVQAFPLGNSKDERKQREQGVVTKDQARELWMRGYVKMQEAARAEDEKNRMLALELYREAADTFTDVAAKYPDWNSSLVQYRLEYCRTRIRRLGTVAAEEASSLSKGELLSLTEEQQKRIKTLDKQIGKLADERDRLSEQVSELRGTVDELSTSGDAIAELKDQIEVLQQEKQDVQNARERLRKRIQSLEEQVRNSEGERRKLMARLDSAKGGDEQELNELREEINTLNDKNTELKKQLNKREKTLNDCRRQSTKLQKQVEQLTDQQKNAPQVDTDKLRETNKALTEQTEKLRRNAVRLRDELQTAKSQLAETEEALAAKTAMQKQLETMRDTMKDRAEQIADLNRELEGLRARQEAEKNAEEDKEATLANLLDDARTAERDGDMDAAIQAYRSVLELQPDNTEIRLHLGTLLLDRGLNAEAQDVLDPAFVANPDNTEIYTPLGLSLLRREKADMALAIFARGVALEPRNADFHRYLGLATRSLGWTDATEAAFRRSFNLDDTSGETAYNLALHYMTLDKPRAAEAKKWYDKAIALGQPPDKQLEEAINAYL